MPLTPHFTLSQTPATVVLVVRVPHIRVTQLELVVDGTTVSVSVRPYLLSLTLPGRVQETESAKTTYDPGKDGGTLTIILDKTNVGEHFENLSMITSLLSSTPIKESGSSGPTEVGEVFENGYGFGRGYSCLFGCVDANTMSAFLNEFPQLMELRDGGTSHEQRQDQRQRDEDKAFSLSRFRQDTFGEEVMSDEIYVQAKNFVPQHETYHHRASGGGTFSFHTLQDTTPPDIHALVASFGTIAVDSVFSFGATSTTTSLPPSCTEFSLTERNQLSRLRNKSFTWLLNDMEAFLSILDVVLAFSHELRLTGGETNVESALTIRKLSATLSYSVYFNEVEQVFKAFSRRALCYSFLRKWDLICLAAHDTNNLWQCGKVEIVRSLLVVKSLMAGSDTMYLLNRLFVDDMLIWIQGISEMRYRDFATQVDAMTKKTFVIGTRLPLSTFVGWKLLGGRVAAANVDGQVNERDGVEVFEGLD